MTPTAAAAMFDDADIDAYIQTHLPIRADRKDRAGEVFTPPALIDQMLDRLPPSVWRDPAGVWLDPAAGAGFFMLRVFQRLMRGLAQWEPRPAPRARHILHKMLYLVELDRRNARLCRGWFANVQQADCLTVRLPLPPHSVSYLVGNPPFQDDLGVSAATGKRIRGGKGKLYERIVQRCLDDWLAPGGWMCLLVPLNAFGGNHVAVYRSLVRERVHYLNVSPENERQFRAQGGIQQPVGFFVLERTSGKEPATNKDETNKHQQTNKTKTVIDTGSRTFSVQLQDRPVNPVYDWTPQTEAWIRAYVQPERNVVQYHRGRALSAYRRTPGKAKARARYRIVYTPRQSLYADRPALAPGVGQPKAIVFVISPQLDFVMDWTGALGAGPNTFTVPFASRAQGQRVERFLKSEVYRRLAVATRSSRQFLKYAFVQHLNLARILGPGPGPGPGSGPTANRRTVRRASQKRCQRKGRAGKGTVRR